MPRDPKSADIAEYVGIPPWRAALMDAVDVEIHHRVELAHRIAEKVSQTDQQWKIQGAPNQRDAP